MIFLSIYKIHTQLRCSRVHFIVLKPILLRAINDTYMLHPILCLNYSLCIHIFIYVVYFVELIITHLKYIIVLDLYNM